MRFKTYITEATFSSAKLEQVAAALSGAIGNKIGMKFWRFGGSNHIEHFKRSDGTSGVGIPYILDNGRMIRFNLETHADSSELSSVDVWKNLKASAKPTMTLEVPAQFNSVEAVDIIATFIRSFKLTLKEALELDEARASKYDDREALAKQYGVPDHLDDKDFKAAVYFAKKFLQLTGKQEISTLTQDIEKAQEIATNAKISPEVLFQDLEDLVHLVATGSQPSLLITGMAGVGKCVSGDTLLNIIM